MVDTNRGNRLSGGKGSPPSDTNGRGHVEDLGSHSYASRATRKVP